MYKQIKYELKVRGNLRIVTLMAAVLINAGLALVFGVLGMLGETGSVLSIVFSSLTLAALVFIALFNDLDAVSRLFFAPSAYLTLLTPVKPWKLLASRTLINIVQDFVLTAVGVLGLLLQIGMISRFPSIPAEISSSYWLSEAITYGILIIANYIFFILVIYFAVALTRTILAGIKGRTPLAVLAAFACMYLHNALDVVLYPFSNGSARTFGPVLAITLEIGSGIGVVAVIALALLKCAALFFATCKLMERKLNV